MGPSDTLPLLIFVLEKENSCQPMVQEIWCKDLTPCMSVGGNGFSSPSSEAYVMPFVYQSLGRFSRYWHKVKVEIRSLLAEVQSEIYRHLWERNFLISRTLARRFAWGQLLSIVRLISVAVHSTRDEGEPEWGHLMAAWRPLTEALVETGSAFFPRMLFPDEKTISSLSWSALLEQRKFDPSFCLGYLVPG